MHVTQNQFAIRNPLNLIIVKKGGSFGYNVDGKEINGDWTEKNTKNLYVMIFLYLSFQITLLSSCGVFSIPAL